MYASDEEMADPEAEEEETPENKYYEAKGKSSTLFFSPLISLEIEKLTKQLDSCFHNKQTKRFG